MGAPKQTVLFEGRPLLTIAVEQTLRVCSRCIVVTGANREHVQSAIPRRAEVEEVYNPNYEEGMLSSIACGTRQVRSPWFFVLPGDMPRVPVEVFETLLRAARLADAESGATAIFPIHGGRRGHPVLISRRVIPDLHLQVGQHHSMRDFLSQYDSQGVEVFDAGIALDIDTPEDLALAEDTGGKWDKQHETE